MQEEGLSPKEATEKSMREITGALIGIATVLSAVFVPMAFFGGSVGVIYRQFSVTIVSAMVLSVLVAMILTPALCATILRRPHDHGSTRGLFGWFNRTFERTSNGYRAGAGGVVARPIRYLAAFVAMVVVMGVLFVRLPSSFLPDEDQGVLFTVVQMPVGATTERTAKVLEQVTNHYLTAEKDAVR
jgi:multidrug efflux pump